MANTPGSSSSKGTIAVDMDDVLAQTNTMVMHMHNERFKTEPPLTMDDFKYYGYWYNRGWGDQRNTVRMVQELVQDGLYEKSPPIEGAKEGLMKLKKMGYKLIIITARGEKTREESEDWIAKYMPDIFDEIHFTGAFVHLEPTQEEKEGHVAKKAIVSHKKRSKADICHQTNAFLMIDDSSENILSISSADPPIKGLLFGSYGWNSAIRSPESDVHPDDRSLEEGGLTYIQKVEKGVFEESEKRRDKVIKEGWLPKGVERVKNWEEVVMWVERREREGNQSQMS